MFDVFCDGKMLSNIRDAMQDRVLHRNSGATSVTKKGDLKGYGTILYYLDSIMNHFSLKNVKKKCRFTFDSEQDD